MNTGMYTNQNDCKSRECVTDGTISPENQSSLDDDSDSSIMNKLKSEGQPVLA